MLKSLKFVQGSIGKKNLVPSLRHFIIRDGYVQGYNGIISLHSPIPIDINCQPEAISMVKAISNCEEEIKMSLLKSGKLSIRSGRYRAQVNCLQEEAIVVQPEGEEVDIDGNIVLDVCKKMEPFIGDDASRRWSNGILFIGNSAFSTNNVILCEYWTQFNIKTPFNVPYAAVREIIRINQPVEKIRISNNSATFYFNDDKWLRTQLLEITWPNLKPIINVPDIHYVDLDNKIFEAIDKIEPFLDKGARVFIQDGKVSSHLTDEEGSSYEIDDKTASGCYQSHMLNLLKGMTKIDWSKYPKPCPFKDDSGKFRGVIVGMRMNNG